MGAILAGLSLFKSNKFLLIAGGIGLAFVLGLGLGNYWTTQRAIQAAILAEQDASARRQAAVNGALLAHEKETVARINAAVSAAHAADMAAHQEYEAGLSNAAKRRAEAERQLRQIKEANDVLHLQNDGLKAVNKDLGEQMASMPAPCVMPPAVRRVLDQASGASDGSGNRSGSDGSQGNSSGGADAGASERAISPLSCEQLVEGYVLLGEWGQNIAAQLQALQAWERQRP